MPYRRAPIALGAAAAGGIGYYLYSAGGNPRVAERKFEADAHRASSKLKESIPPPHDASSYRSSNYDSQSPISSSRSSSSSIRTDESAEQKGARVGQQVGGKIDSAVNDLSKAKQDTESYAKQTKAEALRKIDDFDRTVEEKAAKSKSYLSGWFGSGNK
ncbi:hypothetical protein QBC38DRAFT_496771 [Podospora fimiseda]|uniref:Calcofluor white hypersensitive protein n=1 Tax=Podospora fimiseda TaxID=252190 RepID=A0AAN7H6A8_9PEZI|nr:hypothetical protein QBC38DRAFT_496771 [Podospora fimiseda]